MTQDEFGHLSDIVNTKPWEARNRLAEYLKTVIVSEEKEARTQSQHNALFLWLGQIADQCRKLGITADLLFRHTSEVLITKEMLHTTLKTLLEVKWGITTTKNIEKTGHIEEIQDTFALWLGKEGVEIPPFPSKEGLLIKQLYGE